VSKHDPALVVVGGITFQVMPAKDFIDYIKLPKKA
jgi:hypothetical protein